MKRNIFILALILVAFGLTAFGLTNWNKTTTHQNPAVCKGLIEINQLNLNGRQATKYPDFIYHVDSRFLTTITLENLHKANTVFDLVPEKATENMSSFTNVKVYAGSDLNDKFIRTENEKLNAAQKTLFKSMNYSSNFHIEAYCQYKNPETGEKESYNFVYYITIVPEHEAEFNLGYDALIQYLKDNSQDELAVISGNDLQAGLIQFTVNSKGEVSNVSLNSTSGYMILDVAFLDLIPKTSGKWTPATNSRGEKIDQDLIFFFGREGC